MTTKYSIAILSILLVTILATLSTQTTATKCPSRRCSKDRRTVRRRCRKYPHCEVIRCSRRKGGVRCAPKPTTSAPATTTPSPSVTSTPTPTPTTTPTSSPTPSSSSSPSPTPSITPTVSPSSTPTATPSSTPSASPSPQCTVSASYILNLTTIKCRCGSTTTYEKRYTTFSKSKCVKTCMSEKTELDASCAAGTLENSEVTAEIKDCCSNHCSGVWKYSNCY